MNILRFMIVLCVMLSSAVAYYISNRGDEVCTSTGEQFVLPPAASAEIRFAVIGDYGKNGENETAVVTMIDSWQPDFIITVGDNNYEDGEAATLDENVGVYFSDYIAAGRFYPTLGNHDWRSDIEGSYLPYFDLPGNERYYTFTEGPVQFFALDSDLNEPDGVSNDSIQAQWLQNELSISTTAFQIIYFHHPPYSSGRHGGTSYMRWSFADWGADAILSGHDHTYERIQGGDGLPYFINGLGGKSIYKFPNEVNGSQIRFNCAYGAMLVDATSTKLRFYFVTTDGLLVDEYTLPAT